MSSLPCASCSVDAIDDALLRRDDAGGDAVVEAEGVADGDRPARRRARRRSRPAAAPAAAAWSLDLEQRDVGGRVGAHDAGGQLAPVVEAHAQIDDAAHDVLVGDDVAVLVDDEARCRSTSRPPRCPVRRRRCRRRISPRTCTTAARARSASSARRARRPCRLVPRRARSTARRLARWARDGHREQPDVRTTTRPRPRTITCGASGRAYAIDAGAGALSAIARSDASRRRSWRSRPGEKLVLGRAGVGRHAGRVADAGLSTSLSSSPCADAAPDVVDQRPGGLLRPVDQLLRFLGLPDGVQVLEQRVRSQLARSRRTRRTRGTPTRPMPSLSKRNIRSPSAQDLVPARNTIWPEAGTSSSRAQPALQARYGAPTRDGRDRGPIPAGSLRARQLWKIRPAWSTCPIFIGAPARQIFCEFFLRCRVAPIESVDGDQVGAGLLGQLFQASCGRRARSSRRPGSTRCRGRRAAPPSAPATARRAPASARRRRRPTGSARTC